MDWFGWVVGGCGRSSKVVGGVSRGGPFLNLRVWRWNRMDIIAAAQCVSLFSCRVSSGCRVASCSTSGGDGHYYIVVLNNIILI